MRKDTIIAIRNQAKTHCKHGHEFTPENTYFTDPQGFHRRCRTCSGFFASAFFFYIGPFGHSPLQALIAAVGSIGFGYWAWTERLATLHYAQLYADRDMEA